MCVLFLSLTLQLSKHLNLLNTILLDLRRCFDDADDDGSGSIDKKEFKKMLKKLGPYPGDKEYEVLFREIDEDGNLL